MIDRLSVLDASMLRLESATTPLHTGGISIFAPGLEYETLEALLKGRLQQVPYARQRVLAAPLGSNPVWIDDDAFDLTYHLRHASLPAPGDMAQLGEYVSRLLERPLDRERPLWEIYLIEGLEGGRTAVFRKTHLAIAGGDRGDAFGAMLAEQPRPVPRPQDSQWHARPAPSSLTLARESLKALQDESVSLVREASSIALNPVKAFGVAGHVVGATAGMVLRLARAQPDSPLNAELSRHRRFAFASTELATLRKIRRRFGGSINDIVVSVCADAVGRLLRWRGFDTGSLDLRVMVPVRIHSPTRLEESPGAPLVGDVPVGGDGAVGVLAPLPVMAMDPISRLYRVMGELAGVKESRQAVAAESLVRLAGYAPPSLHATAARVVMGADRYNLALSNAPGPQTPRYLGETRMEASYPYVPLAGTAPLSIAVSSYVGRLDFGLLGDRAAMPDIDQLARFVLAAVDDLYHAPA